MEQQQQQLNVLSPFLGKAETLLTLVLVLVLSVAWLMWEILSFVHRESEDANHDWWEALKNCPHRRLIIPVRMRACTVARWMGASCRPAGVIILAITSHTAFTPFTPTPTQPNCVEEMPELGTLSRLTTVRVVAAPSRAEQWVAGPMPGPSIPSS